MSEIVNVRLMVGYNSRDLGEQDNMYRVNASWQEVYKVMF